MSAPNDIVLYQYPFSPYARRVIWYLQLRGLNYAQCLQPPTLPREDVNALGIKYRRIPILAIGCDVYLDTRLILRKLETLFPNHRALSSFEPSQKAQEKLLEDWTIDGGVFTLASKLIPPELPLLKEQKFQRDREDFSGRSWSLEDVKKQRPEALAGMRNCWETLEGLLGDGREWICGTREIGIGDINAVWPFHWLLDLKQALLPDVFSKEQYPRTHAWIERFSSALASAKSSAPKPVTMKGAEALRCITQAQSAEEEKGVDVKDPLGLKKGQDVDLWPTDTGSRHKDRGKLISLTVNEVVIAAQSKVSGKEIRIHAPRWGFRIQPVQGTDAKL